MSEDKTQTEETQKIKVGEVEFEPEELQEVVGAGMRLKEIEEKQGQPVDDILKSWGRRGEEIGNYKKQVEELNQKLEELNKQPPATTAESAESEEEVKKQVIAEAKKFGLLTREEANEMFDQVYQERRNAEKLISRTRNVIRKAKADGKPEVELESLLEYMADPNNPRDPQNAYEQMFKKELRELELSKLQSIKNQGMTTETQTGEKEPERQPIRTKDGLTDALKEHFAQSGN
jgi:polyhydroxyalkanoate synthesis regulator phasin